MFQGCTALIASSPLTASTLAPNCYYNMFAGCTSLNNVPSTLLVNTLAPSCYYGMFSGCTSLPFAP